MSSIWVELMGSEVRYLGRDYRTRVLEAGEGAPLLLLHGIGGHAEAWARNIVRLGRSHRAMAIDLLWHGFSARPEYVDGKDISTYGLQVLDLMDSEGIETIDIEGESLGGWVGMWLALNHRDRLGRLILNTTAGIRWQPGSVPERPAQGRKLLAERSLAAIDDPTPETIRKRLEWLMASPELVTEELVDVRIRLYSDPQVKASLRRVFENAFAGVGGPRETIPEERLAENDVPTLVLWTDKNPGAGPPIGERIASLIPGARYHCIADAAHWPQWEQPEEHDRVVTEFLMSDDSGDAG